MGSVAGSVTACEGTWPAVIDGGAVEVLPDALVAIANEGDT